VEAETVAVDVPLLGDERRKNWAKVVDGVDDTRTGGWAYEGRFIAVGGIQDVPVGSVVLVYGERGGRATPQIEARVYTVGATGSLTARGAARGRAWARTLRDTVAALLDEEAGREEQVLDWDERLPRYSDAAILEELRRRGLR